jgi:hypothetical protein
MDHHMRYPRIGVVVVVVVVADPVPVKIWESMQSVTQLIR